MTSATWDRTNEINTNPANILDAWNVGDASDWTATTPDEVEQALRQQAAESDPFGEQPVSDAQFAHDAAIIARWLAEERAGERTMS